MPGTVGKIAVYMPGKEYRPVTWTQKFGRSCMSWPYPTTASTDAATVGVPLAEGLGI